jgi:hypothetical protein
MNLFHRLLFVLGLVLGLLPSTQVFAQSSQCKDSAQYETCKGQCISRYCPLTLPLCQRAFNKCRPKCFDRHCG